MTINIKREKPEIVQNTVVVQSSSKTTQRLSTVTQSSEWTHEAG